MQISSYLYSFNRLLIIYLNIDLILMEYYCLQQVMRTIQSAAIIMTEY